MALQAQLRAARTGGPPPSGEGRGQPPRWDLLAAWLLILLPAVTLTAILASRQRVDDLEDRLVRDANALFSRSNPRPVHVDAPVPGTIGGRAAPHLAPIARVERRLDGELPTLREVVAGTTPVGALREPVRAALAEVGPDLDALLAATRAERADFPDALDLAGDGAWIKTWQLVALLAGVRMRLELAAGDARGAVRDGLDALALGRDVAIARGMVGRMMGAGIVTRLAPAVSSAVDALPGGDDRRDALRRIRAIRDALPPFSRTLGDEMIQTELAMGELLPARILASLDPRARAEVRGGMRDTTWWARLAARDGWRDVREAQDELVSTADLPDAERAAAWKRLDARLMKLVNPFAAIALPNWERFARRADASVRRLDALVLAAAAGAFRDSHGRWPRSVEELASAGELGAAEAARLEAAELHVEPSDGTLSLATPLPRPDEKEPGELRLVLRGRSGARR